MKVSKKFLTLMVALSAGSAFAVDTAAGTAIKNIATASFEDPGDPTKKIDVPSNEVTTFVNAVNGFDIIYSDNSADGTTPTTPAATYDIGGVLPGQAVTTKYRVVNNGNIDNYVVNLTADTTNLPAGSVQYFLDTNEDGVADNATAITSVTLANGGTQGIVQVITVPPGATPNAEYAASPKGSAPAGTAGNGVNYALYNEAANDLQYTRATVYAPQAVVGPNSFPTGNGTGSYQDGNTTITRSGDSQTAAPDAGDLTTVFLNTLQNNGAQVDSFTLTSTTPTGTTVEFRTPNGQSITGPVTENGVTYDVDGSGNVVVKNVPVNGVANFQTVVTYPLTPSQVSVTVNIESASDADTNVDDSTTNLINVPGLEFGNKTPGGADPTPNPNPTVTPGNPAQINMQVENDGGGDETYTFTTTQVPFDVVDNTGTITTVQQTVTYFEDADCDGVADNANGSATLALTVVAGGTKCAVAVVNVPANAVKQTTPPITQTVTGTSTITAQDTNDTVTVTVGRVPQITPPPAGYGPNVLIAKFTAKAGTTAGTETAPSGQTNPQDYTTGNTYAGPGDTVSYRIIAKNIYNANVAMFSLKDTVPTNTTLTNLSLSRNGTTPPPGNVIYSTDGGTTWTKLTTAPTVTAGGTTYMVGVDGNNDNLPDALGANQTMELEFEVTVN